MFKNKKILYISTLILVLLIFILLALFFLLNNKTIINKNKNDISVLINSNKVEYENALPQAEVDRLLLQISNEKYSESERYGALATLFDYYNNAYFNTNSPIFRKDGELIEKYAEENFNKLHKKGAFIMACADIECGESTPKEIEALIKDIEKLNIDNQWKNSILLNIKTASHIPNKSKVNIADKLNSYDIAMQELNSLNNPQASRAADRLKVYLKNKYNYK